MRKQVEMSGFERAKDWYQNLASNMDRAGVKRRLYSSYPTVTDEKEAFTLACEDERAGKPLP